MKVNNCPEGHTLLQLNDILKETKHENQYVNNEFKCSSCEEQNIPASEGVYHCDICPYDLCSSCKDGKSKKENSKEIDKTKVKNKKNETILADNSDERKCLNGHKLIKVLDILAITKNENSYPNNHYRCIKCQIRRDSTKYESNHCDECIYDICEHCLKGHQFILTNDLANNSEDPRYHENTYLCNVCIIDYECTKREGAYHCEECLYDVCPSCFKDLYSE